MQKTLLLYLSSVLLMTACDHKEILKGRRENFFTATDSAEIDRSIAGTPVNIQAASILTQHTDVGGNIHHNAINYKMNNTIKTYWKTAVGSNVGTDLISYHNNIYAVNRNGELFCIEGETGKLLWRKLISSSKDRIAFAGGINVSNGNIIVTTNRGEIIKIDPKTQKELLRYTVKLPVKSNPVIVDDKIIVTTIDNKTLAFSEKSRGKIWEKTGLQEETIMEGNSTPAVYGNTLICAYTNGDIASLDLHGGTELWEDTLFPGDTSESGFVISHIVASPVIYNDKVLACTSESKTALIDAASGIRIWEKNIGTINTPVISNNWAFILTTEGSLKCLSITDGAIKWSHTFNMKGRLFGPLIINGDIVVFSENGDMITVSAQNGRQKSTKNLGTTISKTPIIVNSGMYIAALNSDIVCLK